MRVLTNNKTNKFNRNKDKVPNNLKTNFWMILNILYKLVNRLYLLEKLFCSLVQFNK